MDENRDLAMGGDLHVSLPRTIAEMPSKVAQEAERASNAASQRDRRPSIFCPTK